MDILIVMCIGILVGRVSILRRGQKRKMNIFSLFCTFYFVFFSMGVMLRKRKILFFLEVIYHRLV